MPAIPGSVTVTGFVAPSDSTDTYPAQKAIYGNGGLREVADYTELNAITTARRSAGMITYVQATSEYWKLNNGPWGGTIADWTLTNIGTGGGTDIITALTNGVAVTVDSLATHTVGSAVWEITLYNTTGSRERWRVEATNDAYLANDATAANYTINGLGPNNGHTIEVDVSGAGLSQVMRLRITAAAANWSATVRELVLQTAGTA